jgi:hypothetical protein
LDEKKRTPLFIAAEKGHIECIKVLLAGKANVNLAADDSIGGYVALHEAALRGNQDIAELLLGANADVQVKTAQGETALQLAEAGGHRKLAAKLGARPKEEDIVSGLAVVAAGGGSYIEGDPEGLLPASDDTRNCVQALMDETWRDTVTRDRADRKVAQFEVVQVMQNANKALWKHYDARREDISLHYVSKLLDIKTVIDSWETRLQEPRQLDVNEFFLFHGTKPTAASAICDTGFRVDLSGSNRGALYGPGVYCAESSAKADEYAEDDADGIYKGLYAMLLCRVSLGNVLVNEEVQPDVEEITRQLEAGDKHSILGNREKIRGTYREFVIRNPQQVYPAYAIIYRRNTS